MDAQDDIDRIIFVDEFVDRQNGFYYDDDYAEEDDGQEDPDEWWDQAEDAAMGPGPEISRYAQ